MCEKMHQVSFSSQNPTHLLLYPLPPPSPKQIRVFAIELANYKDVTG